MVLALYNWLPDYSGNKVAGEAMGFECASCGGVSDCGDVSETRNRCIAKRVVIPDVFPYLQFL